MYSKKTAGGRCCGAMGNKNADQENVKDRISSSPAAPDRDVLDNHGPIRALASSPHLLVVEDVNPPRKNPYSKFSTVRFTVRSRFGASSIGPVSGAPCPKLAQVSSASPP